MLSVTILEWLVSLKSRPQSHFDMYYRTMLALVHNVVAEHESHIE